MRYDIARWQLACTLLSAADFDYACSMRLLHVSSQENDKDQSITIDTAMKVTGMTLGTAARQVLLGCGTL